MSFETGKRALIFLLSKAEQEKNLEVDFFGGEPFAELGCMQKDLLNTDEAGKRNVIRISVLHLQQTVC